MNIADAGVYIALLAMLAMHFFRGPNRQTDDLREEHGRLRNELGDLRKDQAALSMRISGEHSALVNQLSRDHFTRAEIREMLGEIKEQVGLVQGVVGELKTALALITGAKNGGRNGH